MAPTLYMVPASPPVRAVLMTAKSLGLELNLKQIDMMKGEHKTPEYLKMNPQHTVPTLMDDDGFIIWDSHAIMPYLITKYGKNDALYPKEVQKRSIIDQRLHFDSGTAFARLLKIMRSFIYQGKKSIEQEDIDAINEIYEFVDKFLEGRLWVAGDSVTIADYSLITTITSLDVLVKINREKYTNLAAWLKRADALPVSECNKSGLQAFSNIVKSML